MRLLSCIVLGSLALGAPSQAAQGRASKVAAAMPRVVLAVDGVGQTRNLPVLVAERLHYFTDAGLIVTLVDAPADPSTDTLISDGRADGAVAFYHHTFMTQADRGLASEAVIVMGASPQLKLIVAKRLAGTVRSIADLKGRAIFVGGGNSGKTTTINWLMTRAGLPIDSYRALTPTTPAAMAAALRDGGADAIIAHEPDASSYLADSGVLLADIDSIAGTRASLGDIYPSTSLYMPRAYVASHPAIVQKLVGALLRAMTFIKSHNAEEIAAVLPARPKGEDRKAFLATLEDDRQAFDTDGRMSVSAARRQLATMAALSPRYAGVNIDLTYTNIFVDRASR
ncbi:MAG: ABC transporter substrate-binding protein [Proteobacteria bacterium]|nr:ABC transporter substrate-binding protein [Pseudomonadota bacterium]